MIFFVSAHLDNLSSSVWSAKHPGGDNFNKLILYRDQLEKGETHDDLWNASQKEMKYHGKMSSWNRMYWAKKVRQLHAYKKLRQNQDFRTIALRR